MGAFGRLLIEYWGGDLATYEGRSSTSKPNPKPKSPSNKELEEADERLLENITQASDTIIRKGEEMLRQINSNDIYHHFQTERGMADFEKWKNKFMNKLEA